jgi:fumarate reductase flavoprotein subunit
VVKTDVVVVGAGGTGLAAALTAAEGGATVILFEKNSTAGGAAGFASGPFAVQSRLQRQRYIGLSRDEAFMRIMDYSHWRADARLVRAYVDRSADTIDWLEEQGVVFVEPLAMVAGGEFTWHVIEGRGSAMVKALVGKIQDKGVDTRLSTRVRKLTKDGNRVSGVIAEDKSGRITHVSARAVIIGTGGYANNREMVKKYTGFDLGRNLVPPPPGDLLQSTGDGIFMTWEAGGAVDDKMGLIEMNFAVPKLGLGNAPLTGLMRQPYLWVNQQGRRFFNEGVGNYPFRANALAGQKGGYAYLIIDGNTKRYVEQTGIDTGAGLVFAGTKLVDVDEDFRKAINSGKQSTNTTGCVRRAMMTFLPRIPDISNRSKTPNSMPSGSSRSF